MSLENKIKWSKVKNNPEYNKYDDMGIYSEKCGIENLHLSYGHDE